MKLTARLTILSFMGMLVAACASSDNYAPVADVSVFESMPASGVYHVQPGDTLYSIAWRYGRDYQSIAEANNIAAPYAIHAGERIYLKGRHPPVRQVVTEKHPAKSQKLTKPMPLLPAKKHPQAEPDFAINHWLWPAHGKLVTLYSKRNKGIDIGAAQHAPVTAALPGKVVYAGNGLRGYGNLIILKHNSEYLSAYAYNSKLLVHDGDWVRAGQKIAEMGSGPYGKPQLHFEIRRAGLPVNPLNLLNN